MLTLREFEGRIVDSSPEILNDQNDSGEQRRRVLLEVPEDRLEVGYGVAPREMLVANTLPEGLTIRFPECVSRTAQIGSRFLIASVPDGFVHLMPCVAARRSQHISFFSFKPAFSAKALKVSPSCSIAHRKLRTKFCWRSVFAGFGVAVTFSAASLVFRSLCASLTATFQLRANTPESVRQRIPADPNRESQLKLLNRPFQVAD